VVRQLELADFYQFHTSFLLSPLENENRDLHQKFQLNISNEVQQYKAAIVQ